MQTFSASIELDAEDAAALHTAARFYSLPVPTFLNACLQQAVEQAISMAALADMDGDTPDRD